MVSNTSGNERRLPQNFIRIWGSSNTPNRPGVHNESRSSRVSGMTHIREFFASRGISSEALALLLTSWTSKTQSNYNSLCAKWSRWCSQKNYFGTSRRHSKFFAELFKEGYRYRSLNYYGSLCRLMTTWWDNIPWLQCILTNPNSSVPKLRKACSD